MPKREEVQAARERLVQYARDLERSKLNPEIVESIGLVMGHVAYLEELLGSTRTSMLKKLMAAFDKLIIDQEYD